MHTHIINAILVKMARLNSQKQNLLNCPKFCACIYLYGWLIESLESGRKMENFLLVKNIVTLISVDILFHTRFSRRFGSERDTVIY